MLGNVKEKIKIIELKKGEVSYEKLQYKCTISNYYDLEIHTEPEPWKISLTLKSFGKTIEKNNESKLFSEFVEEPRLFVAELYGEHVGWIELGYQKWNNRMRVWEFLVKEEFRRKGIGRLLMEQAVKITKEKEARMLVLETQSCNTPAIGFYQKFGFELIGFDAAAYSNEDIEKKEARLEFGLRIK
jgi:ribosomal protein S18 acetylase RimI-like enzyme